MKIKAIRGTKDILPNDAIIWRCLEEKVRQICELYGYQEIRTPILEEARLFTRSIGTDSDIVRKEMYHFTDRKHRILCLRPEGTASVVRAYIEHNLDNTQEVTKFYYFGPMFRAERPQAGRLRQFHHIGIEAIGSDSPYLDVEAILLAVNILEQIGVKGFHLQLNSIGCEKDRKEYKLRLKKSLKEKIGSLCADCHNRYKTNILRIFDCKNEGCKKSARRLPSIIDTLCPECTEHFLKVRSTLDDLNVTYHLNPFLVRGLDYYTQTCFEIVHPRLGAQNAIGAGGRYDNLVTDLGGAKKPAVGFALGVERIIAVLEGIKTKEANLKTPFIYVATVGEQVQQSAFKILNSLRKKGVFAEMNYQNKSLKAQMRLVNRLGCKYVAILGEEELRKEVLILRDMHSKTQKEIKIANLIKELK